MGIGFMVDWRKWAFPIQSPLPTHPSTKHQPHQHSHTSSLRAREASFESGRLSTLHLLPEGGESFHRDTLKAYTCSLGALQTTEIFATEMKEVKFDKQSRRGSHNLSRPTTMMEDASANLSSLTANNSLHFSLLMENLDKIEDILSGTDLVRLERDILVQIRRLGALRLFHTCLSRTLTVPASLNSIPPPAKHSRESPLDYQVHDHKGNIVVHSGKKAKRKLRRTRASEKSTKMTTLSEASKRIHKVKEPTVSFPISLHHPAGSSKSRSRRLLIARNESEMSSGVKEVTNLEKTCIKLEEELGQPASFARWAEAAGVDQKTLHERLHFGWYCRDELIKSTHSLVVYLARNYRGMGIAFDDLLQAGSMGVLKGAERFDNTRGYRFSTYVQYWIRKSMLGLVSCHSRGIRIPARMEKTINRVQRARKALRNRAGRYPTDDETAELTGLSLANVRLASKCSIGMGSIDQEIGHGWRTKFMEITPDTSVKTPDEVVMRQHMTEDIIELLEDLHPRERQVLVLRYGLEDGRCRSLEEIGRLFRVTKEWIRKVEKAAMAKIRKEDIQIELKYYIHL